MDAFQDLFITTATLVAASAGVTLLLTSWARFVARREIRDLRSGIQEERVEDAVSRLKCESESVQDRIDKGRPILERLQALYSKVSDQLRAIDLGLVPPTFSFTDDEVLKERIGSARKKQLHTIDSGKAVSCPLSWTVSDSRTEGRKMTTAYQHLALKAFNDEFEFIRKVMRHSTLDTAMGKLSRLNDQIDKLGAPLGVQLEREYVFEKENELRTWHGDLVRKEGHKLELKKRRALMKAQTTRGVSEDEIDEIADNIDEKERALLRAKERAKLLFSEEGDAKTREIEQLMIEIEKLKEKKQRALSQAQVTRAGYVYVISNLGCYGDGVVKIGMTRRLHPLERIVELSGASVAFRFDVHTMAFTEDAPSLETALHRAFDSSRLNPEMLRKEFFRATPREVEAEMARLDVESDWYYEVEAREYRESMLLREAAQERTDALSAQQAELAEFPKTI